MLTRKLLRDLWRWRAQVVAIVAIVACGIASFVALISVYRSLESSLNAYYARYAFAQIFDQVSRAPDLVRKEISRVLGVTGVETRVVQDVTLDVPGRDEPATGRLVSIPESGPPLINGLHMREGRYIAPNAHGEVIASEAFASGNDLHVGSVLGAVINGRWERLRVVGIAISPEYVYELRYGELYPDAAHFGVLWMGNQELSAALDMKHSFNDVALTIAPRTNEQQVIAALDRILNRYGGVGAYGRSDQLSARFLSEEFTQLGTTASIVPLIFLSVAAFLLNMLLLRLVGTQRDQIAVLKAFGFRNITIVLHFLTFVFIIVLLGAGVGYGVGIWWGHVFADMYRRFFHLPLLSYQADTSVFIMALAISALSSVAGAFLAVRSALALAPAEAMRPEPPAGYRTTVLERWGAAARLSLTARIVIRNLERKPVVTLLSALGVGLAIGLLMLGRFTSEGIDRMADLQFRHFQHEDATVVFTHALGPGAVHDLASYPGVIRVEPFRTASVRASYGHVWRKVAITGLSRDDELRPIFSGETQRVTVPPDGVLLSRKLAAVLGASVGDLITLQVLTDRRPLLRMRVVGTVNDFVGAAVYCSIDVLGKALKEHARVSGAYVTVDQRRATEFYHELKRTPNVAGVTFRVASMNSFYRIIAQGLSFDILFVLFFACIIAFGIAYNAARISLSERARELSSLRILGFTRNETWKILVGEQFALALFATPPGIAIGMFFGWAMTQAFQTEYYRISVPATPSSIAFALIFMLAMTAISALIVRSQVRRLDLVSVLKAGD